MIFSLLCPVGSVQGISGHTCVFSNRAIGLRLATGKANYCQLFGKLNNFALLHYVAKNVPDPEAPET